MGATSPERMEEVVAHVQDCAGCQARLDDLSDRTTPLVARLRRARELSPPEPAVEQAVLLARQAIQTRGKARTPLELGEYRLLERLGEGGMGQVYRAIHTRLGKVVALKVLAASQGGDPNAVARFEREMKAVGALSHPNIVGASDAGEVGGRHYLVMEFVPGSDLARLVKTHGPLPVEAACAIACLVAEGLAYAHGQGLVHRDIKPSNVMLTPEGQVKILDLGLALLKQDSPDRREAAHSPEGDALESPTVSGAEMLTSISCVVGTNDYMAPEQWRNSHEVGAAADQYSLGCTLFHLLAGRPPFATPEPVSPLEKCQAHRLAPAPSVRGARPEVPSRLEQVLLRMLAKSPAERYPDAAAVAEALRPFGGKGDLSGLLEAPPGKVGARATRRGRRLTAAWWVLLVLAVAVVAAVVAAAWWLLGMARGPSSEPQAPAEGRIPMSAEEARALQRLWGRHLGQPVVERNSLGMEMLLIPPGAFGMGSDVTVRLTRPYRLGATEVTVGQFRAFVEATRHRTEPEVSGKGGHLYVAGRKHDGPVRDPRHLWSAPGHPGVTGDHPVTQVAWVDAAAFCRWLGRREGKAYRLPTEAEWKWACRAGSTAPYVLGDTLEDLRRHAWVSQNAGQRPMPVAGRVANAWGLYDMLGNVNEWVQDWHQELPPGTLTDPSGPATGTRKVVLGSPYYSVLVTWQARSKQPPGVATDYLGFRVMCEVADAADPAR